MEYKVQVVEQPNLEFLKGLDKIYKKVPEEIEFPHFYFLALDEDQVVGASVLINMNGQWILDSLKVLSQLRRQKIGSLLIRKRIEFAQSQGVRKIWYCCSIHNTASLLCHEAFGFKVEREAIPCEAPEPSLWYVLNVP